MVKVMIDPNLPSNKEFLASLSKCSSELESIIKKMEHERKRYQASSNFKENPFQILANGKKRFGVFEIKPGEFSQTQENVLDVFNSQEELENYLEEMKEYEPYIFDNSIMDSASNTYQGPMINLHPDTNIELNLKMRNFLGQLKTHPGINKDLFTITKLETRSGGLRKMFGDQLPEALARGQQSLEKRCTNLSNNQRAEIQFLYDIISDFFADETTRIVELSEMNPRRSSEDLAGKFVKAKETNRNVQFLEGYKRLVIKTIDKYRAGNKTNHIADKILTSACFGLNLINQRDKSILVSNDQDLITLSDLFYDNILPVYMARTVMNAIKLRNPLFIKMPGYEKRTIEAAREHIEWAKNNSDKDTITLGIIYVPDQNRFYTKEVSRAFRNYFNGIEAYRYRKSELISTMALTGLSAKKAIRKLMDS